VGGGEVRGVSPRTGRSRPPTPRARPARGPTLGTVAIVGAGQVGTALGLALRRTGSPLVGEVGLFDRDPAVARASLRRGAGARLLHRLEDALEADTVVLAVPVPAVVDLVARLGPRLRPGTLLLDTGSTKGPVVRAMRRWVPEGVHALGGHPMAGTEVAGPAGARPELLAGAAFALVPVRDDPEALRRGRALVRAVGARPVVLDARAHDRAVARTSHLPHLVAAAVARVAGTASRGPAEALVSSGLLGATRLAASDPEMVAGFLLANDREVGRALAELREALEGAASALDGAGESPQRLVRFLVRARAAAWWLPDGRPHRSERRAR
jgi:prephenate dehydrogenase